VIDACQLYSKKPTFHEAMIMSALGQTRTSTVSTYCKIKGYPEAASQLQSALVTNPHAGYTSAGQPVSIEIV
jgi:hypothetical protein